jgi:hypothetical protein
MGILSWFFNRKIKQKKAIEFNYSYCPNCQRDEILDFGNFCTKCGTALEKKTLPTCECGYPIVSSGFCRDCGKDNRDIKGLIK